MIICKKPAWFHKWIHFYKSWYIILDRLDDQLLQLSYWHGQRQSDSPEPKCFHHLFWQGLNPFHSYKPENCLKERRITFGSWRIGRSNSKKERNDFSIRLVIFTSKFLRFFFQFFWERHISSPIFAWIVFPTFFRSIQRKINQKWIQYSPKNQRFSKKRSKA